MTQEIIEYEPKRRRPDWGVWISIVVVVVSLIYMADRNERMRVLREAEAKAAKAAEKARLRDKAIYRKLEEIQGDADRAEWLARENARRRDLGLDPLPN